MNRNTLIHSLEANKAYYARLFTPARLARDTLHIEQKRILTGIYRQMIDMELSLCSLEAEFGHKYSADQPRVPAGTSDGGQWTSGGGLGAGTQYADSGGIQTDAQVDNSAPDMQAAIQYFQDNAEPKSIGQCATYVREALDEGGFDVESPGGHAYAKNYGPSLETAGFTSVASSTQPATYPAAGYSAQSGDVVVIQATSTSKAGHMAMYDGNQWISDFEQPQFWPGIHYRSEQPSYMIYRYAN